MDSGLEKRGLGPRAAQLMDYHEFKRRQDIAQRIQRFARLSLQFRQDHYSESFSSVLSDNQIDAYAQNVERDPNTFISLNGKLCNGYARSRLENIEQKQTWIVSDICAVQSKTWAYLVSQQIILAKQNQCEEIVIILPKYCNSRVVEQLLFTNRLIQVSGPEFEHVLLQKGSDIALKVKCTVWRGTLSYEK